MFDAANEPYPSPDKPYTWDEFVAVARCLTLDKNGKHPGEDGFDKDNIVQYGAFVNNWTWQMEVWALSNGGAWFSKDGKEVLINSPEAIEFIQKVADLALVEHVSPLNVIPEDNGVGIGIGSGTVAMTTDGTWRLGTDFPNLDINYGIAPLPMIASFALSLFNWNGLGKMTFVGLDNYVKLFTGDSKFYGSLWTTMQYAGMSVVLSIVYSMIIALLLNRKIPARGFFRAIFYLPYVLPAMAVYLGWKWLYDYNHGLFNYVVKLLGGTPIKFLDSSTLVTPSLTIIAVWLSGNLIVIFLAGLQNVPQHLSRGGGDRWRQRMAAVLEDHHPLHDAHHFLQPAHEPCLQPAGDHPGAVPDQGRPRHRQLLYVLHALSAGVQVPQVRLWQRGGGGAVHPDRLLHRHPVCHQQKLDFL